ncbi:MAG: GvpL/GvpF family gas vesicle protein [Candidatus Omnitrophica bacterium]|nr:GvpL/GvpF family gas vesicle protein [Candidatus Omnitrophota bacterium]
MQTAKKELIYLYCITKTKPCRSNLEEIGVRAYPVYFQGTHAVVSKVSPDEFSEDNLKKKLADMTWVEKKILQHEKVIEEIMKDATVIPFKFGTVFQTEENVEGLLREHGLEFKSIISELEGKEEWGLKIYCDLEKFKDSLQNEDGKIKEIEKNIAVSNKGKAYFLKKKKDILINNILNERISEYTRDSFDRLKGPSLDAKINKLLSQEVTQKKEKMVLNAAFLVSKKRIKEFDSILTYFKTKYAHKGLEFAWTGPWPPYNFCAIRGQEK